MAMDLDAFIKSDPLIVLSGVFVAGGVLVAGVMGYLFKESRDHAGTATKIAADLAAQKAAAEIEDLRSQLRESGSHYRLIARQVGSDAAVIDVSKLTASAFDLVNLGSSYKSLENGRFRLRTPAGKGWLYTEQTEADLSAETFVDLPPELAGLGAIPPGADTASLHVWRNGRPLVAPVTAATPNGPKTANWQFWPQVMAQFVDNAALATMFKAVAAQANQGAAASATPGNDPSALTDRLLAILQGRFAMTYLMSQLQSLFQLSALFDNFEAIFETINQVGDVLYARLRFELGGPPETRLVNFREFVVVTVKDGIYLIRIDIPVRDGGGSDAREWTSEWLSGLRLPSGA